MGKSYNIVFSSGNGQQLEVNPSQSTRFSFDWNVLPQGSYNMTFSFNGLLDSNTSVLPCCIDCDLGQTNSFLADTTIRASTSKVIGTMGVSDAFNGQVFMTCASTFNPPIFFESRPTNNSFIVNLRYVNGFGFWAGNYNFVDSFTLILHFELIDPK